MLKETGHRTLRLLRALWRYRRRLAEHGEELQQELAVTLRSAIETRPESSAALSGYRLTMRLFTVAWIVLVTLAVAVAVALWTVKPALALLGIVFLAPGVVMWVLRQTWGMPLDWLTEHDDPSRRVRRADLPGRLRELSVRTARLGNVPRAISDELAALAAEQEQQTE